MLIVRAQYNDEVFYACLEGEKIYPIKGLPYERIEKDGRVFACGDVRLLAPAEPSKVVAVGDNYLDHIKEMNDPIPEEPVIFLKPPSCVIGPEDAIVRPKRSSRVDYEAEFACVIGKRCKNVAYDEAKDYIFGYTCMNDVTARDLQPIDGQWTRAKGFDTFGPLGPVVNTDLDPKNLAVYSRLNGELKQSGNTNTMMRDAYYLVSFISGVMTLEPGDVITMGTPKGVGAMLAGDVIEVEVEGVGILRNPVKDQD